MKITDTSLVVPGFLEPVRARTVIRDHNDLVLESGAIIEVAKAIFVPKSALGAVVRVGVGLGLLALFSKR